MTTGHAVARRCALGVATAVCLLPLFSLGGAPDVPWFLRLLPWAILVLTTWRPLTGLAVLVGLAPLSAQLLAIWRVSAFGVNQMAEVMVLPVLAGSALRMALYRRPDRLRLAEPAAVFGAAILASGLALMLAQPLASGKLWLFASATWVHVTRDYFTDPVAMRTLHDVVIWLEALALAVVVEHTLRTDARAAVALPRLSLVGLAAAASFASVRLVEISLRSTTGLGLSLLEAIVTHARTLRISTHLPDINAAGSYFALGAVPAITGCFATSWTPLQRIGAGGLALTVVIALWLTGSRAGLAATLLIVPATLWALRRPTARSLAVAGVALAGIATFVTWNSDRVAQASGAQAIEIRTEMTRVGLVMALEEPWLGIGVGQFQQASSDYIPKDLIAQFPAARVGENAHNQFVQVLAEVGVVGFAAFLWLFTCVMAPAVTAIWRGATGAALIGWTGGIAALMVSAVFGHPFLTPYVALLGFLAVGLVAGLIPAPLHAEHRWHSRLALAAVTLLMVSVPFRAAHLDVRTDLAGEFRGAADVAASIDDVAYRTAEPASRWFVNAQDSRVEFTLRAASESQVPCTTAILLNGRLVNRVALSTGAWSKVPFSLEVRPRMHRSRRFELQVETPNCTLLVGPLITRR